MGKTRARASNFGGSFPAIVRMSRPVSCDRSIPPTRRPLRGDFGALDRKAIEDANLTVTYAEGPALIAGHGFTTAHIDQTSFEKLLSPSAMQIGVDHGMGCYADKLPEDERSQAVIPDQFRHEIA